MDANTIIDQMGGTGEVARMCGLSPSAVSQWRNHGIPKYWEKFFHAVAPEMFGLPRKRKRFVPKKKPARMAA